jgi:hypothetical protein
MALLCPEMPRKRPLTLAAPPRGISLFKEWRCAGNQIEAIILPFIQARNWIHQFIISGSIRAAWALDLSSSACQRIAIERNTRNNRSSTVNAIGHRRGKSGHERTIRLGGTRDNASENHAGLQHSPNNLACRRG